MYKAAVIGLGFIGARDQVSGDGDVSSTGENAREALEVVMGFHVSSKLGSQWVSLPLEGEDRDLEVKMG